MEGNFCQKCCNDRIIKGVFSGLPSEIQGSQDFLALGQGSSSANLQFPLLHAFEYRPVLADVCTVLIKVCFPLKGAPGQPGTPASLPQILTEVEEVVANLTEYGKKVCYMAHSWCPHCCSMAFLLFIICRVIRETEVSASHL